MHCIYTIPICAPITIVFISNMFYKRMTHVVMTVLGDGSGDSSTMGVAPSANLVMYALEHDPTGYFGRHLCGDLDPSHLLHDAIHYCSDWFALYHLLIRTSAQSTHAET